MMLAKLEGLIYLVPVGLVIFTALFDVGLALGLLLAFAVAWVIYEASRRVRWDDAASIVIHKPNRR